jgi:hypothetical protein
MTPCRMLKLNISRILSFVLFLILLISFAFPRGIAIASYDDLLSLNAAIGLPNWFSITGENRSRYETLNNQFRANSSGNDQILSLRTLVQTELRLNKNFKINAELQDSRAELADQGSRMNSSIVNTAELLQAHLNWKTEDLFMKGSKSQLRGGRFTIDLGKRRLVARNRFRNVIQGYTGIDWKLTAKDESQIRTLLALPVTRQPSDKASLLENKASFDKKTTDQILWGIFYSNLQLPIDNRGEIYIFGLHEDDGPNFATRNRDLYTPGFRIYRSPQKDKFDFELESVFQFGTSRATTSSSDTKDLYHIAFFDHVESGYTFDAKWSPRLYFEYDYASGDGSPNDRRNGGFDKLFGPNVADFGPTSIYTAFTRSNLSSPGARLQIKPDKNLKAYFSYRAFWLASATDTWSGSSRLRDTTGNSGTFLGHQLLLRIKFQIHPNIKIGGGIAYRIDGCFQDTAPNSPNEGNTAYSYAQAILSF